MNQDAVGPAQQGGDDMAPSLSRAGPACHERRPKIGRRQKTTLQPPENAARVVPQPRTAGLRQAAGALNRHKKPLIIIAVILAALALLWSECFFVVNEREQAVVSRFGVIKQVILNEESSFYERYADQLQDEITMNGQVKIKKGSGLHFRIPFIDKVEKFSSMLYTYTSNSETINTSDKKQYNVTTYAQWRIAEPALFSLKLGNPRNAENQLDNLIHPVIVQAINRLTGDDFISNKEALNSALRQGLEHINRDMVGFLSATAY